MPSTYKDKLEQARKIVQQTTENNKSWEVVARDNKRDLLSIVATIRKQANYVGKLSPSMDDQIPAVPSMCLSRSSHGDALAMVQEYTEWTTIVMSIMTDALNEYASLIDDLTRDINSSLSCVRAADRRADSALARSREVEEGDDDDDEDE